MESFSLDMINWDFFGLQLIAVAITAAIVPGLRLTGITGLFLFSLCLSIVNSVLWDTNLFFQLPDGLTTRALSVFAINAGLFFVLVKILPGIEMSGILSAFIAPLVMTGTILLLRQVSGELSFSEIAQTVYDKLDAVKQEATSGSAADSLINR